MIFKRLYLKYSALTSIVLLFPNLVQGQSDSLRTIEMKEFKLTGFRETELVGALGNVHKTMILGGRKSEIIRLRNLPANLAEKTGRQIFAKIPSGLIYDMDGSGNQVNFSVRGLDAHRSWEFNIRQNGTIINSDMYGYPASHYSMPMEAVDRIELIRGTAALQYGQQFGGMLNYILKEPDSTKVFSFEHLSSVGSFGLFASFNAIGGKIGKVTYYGYYHKRVSEGYRDHASSNSDAQYFGVGYEVSKNLVLRGEFSRSTYLYRIPGPLNDAMFAENPRQATRLRNFFSPEIFIPSLTLNWKISERTRLEWISSGVFGGRSSVTFDGFANIHDLVNPETNEFAHRNVDIDEYNSRTSEIRLIHRHTIGQQSSNLSASIRYFNNLFDRQQRGKGTTGFDFDISNTGFSRDITLHSQSIAAAVENQFFLSKKISLTPGIRYEYGQSDMRGRIDYIDPNLVPRSIPYRFFTLGANANYQLRNDSRIYGGVSQAVRPVLFQDLIPGDPLARINENLKHSFGYNAELGWEHNTDYRLKYNLTLFRTYIGDRIGNLLVEDEGHFLIAKSNIGNSRTDGIEFYLDWKFIDSNLFGLSCYTATSFMNGTYLTGTVRNGETNQGISGNRIEGVPNWISRNGISANFATVKILLQHQFVAKSFADALNTVVAPPSGAVGLVPSYHIWDINASWGFFERFLLRTGINNIFDKSYFTKRPQMYPGPGIWPSDGRGYVLSLQVRI